MLVSNSLLIHSILVFGSNTNLMLHIHPTALVDSSALIPPDVLGLWLYHIPVRHQHADRFSIGSFAQCACSVRAVLHACVLYKQLFIFMIASGLASRCY